MQAIKFIKDHGVDKAREVVERAPDGATHLSGFTGQIYKDSGDAVYVWDGMKYHKSIYEHTQGMISLSDLKRLVESVDSVEQFGNDLGGAKQLLGLSKDCTTIELSGSMITVERLKQAISDYDSIYSNDMGDDSHIENHVSPNCKQVNNNES